MPEASCLYYTYRSHFFFVLSMTQFTNTLCNFSSFSFYFFFTLQLFNYFLPRRVLFQLFPTLFTCDEWLMLRLHHHWHGKELRSRYDSIQCVFIHRFGLFPLAFKSMSNRPLWKMSLKVCGALVGQILGFPLKLTNLLLIKMLSALRVCLTLENAETSWFS